MYSTKLGFWILFAGFIVITTITNSKSQYVNSNTDRHLEFKNFQSDKILADKDPSIGYTLQKSADGSTTVPFMVIGDSDKASINADKNTWISPSKRGFLTYNLATNQYKIFWVGGFNYTSKLNVGGRGMELSDLKYYNGYLCASDDKTGVVYKLTDQQSFTWDIMAEGDGNTEKAFKTEWLTVKDGELYAGGYGRPRFGNNDVVESLNDMFIKIIRPDGGQQSVNWTDNYMRLTAYLGINFPGYITHESCQWSKINKRWFFLPRRISTTSYNKEADQYKGSNVLLMTDEHFTQFEKIKVGEFDGSRGFSAFQFVPETQETVMIALKTQEILGKELTTSILVFDAYGNILMKEEQIPGNFKFEGIEFYDWHRV